ncbi:hypothetical protein AnigIFM63604_004847 [Aspergillus niger]|nr:hypothetical protein AnigIFM63326_008064 [Aspergillus niger]GLA49201.1 hypothetical protein AnigIFM63604_004847 [Aspergillus niger]
MSTSTTTTTTTSTIIPPHPHPPSSNTINPGGGPSSPSLSVTLSIPSTTPTPLSSTTASPTSSPTSSPVPRRRFNNHHAIGSLNSTSLSDYGQQDYYCRSRSRSQSPFRYYHHHHRPSSMSMMLLRRRPSKVDLALSEERSRADEDKIERLGLDLLEPRPVDPLLGVGFALDSMDASVFGGDGLDGGVLERSSVQPRFVMGGIFEVMEGRG